MIRLKWNEFRWKMGNDSSRVSDIHELIKTDDFCGFASLIGSVKQTKTYDRDLKSDRNNHFINKFALSNISWTRRLDSRIRWLRSDPSVGILPLWSQWNGLTFIESQTEIKSIWWRKFNDITHGSCSKWTYWHCKLLLFSLKCTNERFRIFPTVVKTTKNDHFRTSLINHAAVFASCIRKLTKLFHFFLFKVNFKNHTRIFIWILSLFEICTKY